MSIDPKFVDLTAGVFRSFFSDLEKKVEGERVSGKELCSSSLPLRVCVQRVAHVTGPHDKEVECGVVQDIKFLHTAFSRLMGQGHLKWTQAALIMEPQVP